MWMGQRLQKQLKVEPEITELSEKQRGRPFLISKELESQVKRIIQELRVLATARGVILAKDANLLAESINFSKYWAKRLLSRMGYVKRKATLKVTISSTELESLKVQYLNDIRTVVTLEEIPMELIVNWDQTPIKFVPVSNWTHDKKGTERIQLAGLDDKRQIMATIAGNILGHLLPAQLIYGGKTSACLPKVDFPPKWHINYSSNHWANEETMVAYIHIILLPYVKETRSKLVLGNSHPALAIYDSFKAQFTPRILSILDSNNIYIVGIPPNCTSQLQPMDLSVNKSLKDSLRQSFQEWYAQVHLQLANEGNHEPVDFRLSILKPLSA